MFETVKMNSKGVSVYVLQTILRMLLFKGADGLPLEIDGDSGENTVFAINSFQSTMRAYGYEVGTNGENDGEFGEKCWKCLLGGDF
mgnify:CR=1 FL=1